MTLETAFSLLASEGQSGVLAFWDSLDTAAREKLLAQIEAIDFKAVARLRGILAAYRSGRAGADADCRADISPAPVTELFGMARDEAYARGEEELRAGRVAALLVAGGQGSRLGFDGPKGCYPIGPLTGESLFYFHARKILAKKLRYGRPLPLYVMTSEANHDATRAFFESKNWFGLAKEDVFFFRQAMWPALDQDGRIVMETPGSVFLSPDGHGGVLSALERSGALADMEARGVETVYHFQVDNPMTDVAAPAAIGFHAAEGADATLLCCRRLDAGEKMGMPVLRGGRTAIVEYTEFGEERMRETNPDGSLRYAWAAPSPYIFAEKFLRRQAEAGLPIHVAHKKVPFTDASGAVVKPAAPNAFKFEKFVFDALAGASKVRCLAFDRREEYSPVKNAEGDKSPNTAKEALSCKWRRWMFSTGWWRAIDPHGCLGTVEIDPAFADSPAALADSRGIDGGTASALREWEGGPLLLRRHV